MTTKTNDTTKTITDTPEHRQTLLDMARQLNAWDSGFEWTDTFEPEELDAMEIKPSELFRALWFGDSDTNVSYPNALLRFDAYQNIEIIDECTLLDEAWDNRDDIIDAWNREADSIDSDIDISDLYDDDEEEA